MIVVALERLAEVGLQDGVGWEDIVAFSAGALTVLTLFVLLFRTPWKRFMAFLEWVEKFQRDWDGEDARPGHSATPGVMERINNIDGEFKRNGGSTLKDAVYRTERAVELVNSRLSAVETNQRHHVEVAAANLDAMGQALAKAGHEPPVFAPFTSAPITVEIDEGN